MKKHFSRILIDKYGVSEEAIEQIQATHKETGNRFEQILIKKKLLTESQLMEALSTVYQIPFWPELPIENIDTDISQYIPIQFLKKHVMVPLNVKSQTATGNHFSHLFDAAGLNGKNHTSIHIVAIRNPSDIQPLDDLIRALGIVDYKIVLSTKNAILSAVNLSSDSSRDSAEQLVQDLEENGADIISQIEDTADLLEDISDAPIIKLVNHIISQSVKVGASDIHAEPYRDSFTIRYRVDGILYDLLKPPKWIQAALISRIKVMAKMNIAEKRLPQDGSFQVKLGEMSIDIRVSTIPTAFGERVVLRLLNKSSALLTLSEIGLLPDRLSQIKNLIQYTNGIVLVTGPTGSGKTTTLYAILSSINKPDINLITIEDPIEYQIKGISQIQVNPKIGLTFARGLRSIVRQDPDVILVGEIRDRETATIAVQSALTGHLVFSTLHTNDSASAITRLVDIGVEPFLISSSVKAVIAQRLIRCLCNDCKEAYTPEELALQRLGISAEQLNNSSIYQAKGCSRCFHTGYKGRIGIFEIMPIDASLSNLILKTFDSNHIKAKAMKSGMLTLRQDGIEKVLRGITTIEEVLRVTQK